MKTTTKIATLKQDLTAIGIHGITGQQIDEGTLAAGTLIKGVTQGVATYDGETPRWTFLASTDGGKSWCKQLTYAKPELVSYYVRYVESQSTNAKIFKLDAGTESAAKREARKQFLGGCQIGSGYVALYNVNPGTTEADPIARWNA